MRAAQQQAPRTERVSELIGRLRAAAADPDSPVDLTQASPSLSDSSPPTSRPRYRGEPSAVFDDSSESTEDSDEFDEQLTAGVSWREQMRKNNAQKKQKKAAPKKKLAKRPPRRAAAAAAAAAGAAGSNAFARRRAAGESELESG